MDYERKTDLPDWLRWSLILFDRAGFPALAFVMVTYICFVTLKEQTRAIDAFKMTINLMTQAIDRNTSSLQSMTQALYQGRKTGG